MIAKKDDRLIDLEYMIPKEFKEDVSRKTPSTVPITPETSAPERKETRCHVCYCDSTGEILLSVIADHAEKHMCSSCLRRRIAPQTARDDCDSTPSLDLSDSKSTNPETEAEERDYSPPDYSSGPVATDADSKGSDPMSMFD